MENEVIKTVLTEILDELKSIRKENIIQLQSLQGLQEKLQSLEEMISASKSKQPALNFNDLHTELEKNYERIKTAISILPKNVTHKKQILLFPEYGAREYYCLVVRKIFFWFFLLLCITYLYSLGKFAIEKFAPPEQVYKNSPSKILNDRLVFPKKMKLVK